MKTLFVCLFLLITAGVFAQNGVISGTVVDKNSQQPLVGVSIVLQNTSPLIGGSTDINGKFRIVAPPGNYTLTMSFVGYKTATRYNIVASTGNVNTITVDLEEDQTTLQEIEVTGSNTVATATLENPLSIQKLTVEEIKSNPGGNFDISRVIQSLPGVSSATGSGGPRNDVIIRGGAPNENVYYLDGIEIPVINHFSTQGSAGGPQGILNVSFIEDVTLSASAFSSRYDNALSSVLQFKQRDGNKERLQGNLRLSGTEFAATIDGPVNKNTTFLASARRSYLQYFFQLIDLPIRPNYWDFQFKITHQLNEKTTLTALGVGAIDEFSFAVPKETTPEKEYVLRSNPTINQDNYTVGVSLKRLTERGYFNLALSRNYFNNRLDKFEDGNENGPKTLDANSDEVENKLRADVNISGKGWKFSYGASLQYVQFRNDFFSQIRKEIRDGDDQIIQPAIIVDNDTDIDFLKYGAFVQYSRTFFNNRFSLSSGIRTDGNTFMDNGSDLLRTLSPRVSLSYAASDKWTFNASWGQYYKIPIYTALGFQSDAGEYVNKKNDYIRSEHYVAGVEFLANDALRFTLEGFYKRYSDYPVSVRDEISLANLGSEFGAIGNEALVSEGKGRTYGFEFFVQQKLTKSTFFVLSYTWYKSEFSGADGILQPSAWDNRNLISGLFGKNFKRNWQLGLKYRFVGGAPYTPYDEFASRINYLSTGTGILDYTRLNDNRLTALNQLDVRVDKKWNFKRVTLDVYLDIQNALFQKFPSIPQYTFDRNEDGSYKTSDGNAVAADGSNAVPILLGDDDPFATPTIGFILEF
jgi:hypothetical protein